MSQKRYLGRLAGLQLWLHPTAPPTYLVLWLLLSAAAFWLLDFPLWQAALGGLLAAALHLGGEIWHNLGHAWAARRVGYPMEGMLFWGPLAASRYPRSEPPLPGRTHIYRALGGPAANALLCLPLALLAWLWRDQPGLLQALLFFSLADNLLVFSIGALIPLGFNDGATLLRWWRRLDEIG